jgi:hypothetical protein
VNRVALLAPAALAAVALGGCFTSWAVSQAAGKPRIWDEQVHEETVPQPGFTEQLAVTMPLLIEMDQPPAPATTSTNGTYTPPPPATPRPFALRCTSSQRGQNAVYHSAFRYGKQWKKGTAVMFLLEGLAATAFYFAGQEEGKEGNLVMGAFFAADAVGTAALFFVPRKDVYRKDDVTVTTQIRSDCPETLDLSIGGDVYPIDAAGRLGELGDLALDDWMQAPSGPLLVGFEGRSYELVVGASDRCTWNRHRQRPADPGCAYGGAAQQYVSVTVVTTPGTLTRAVAPAEAATAE